MATRKRRATKKRRVVGVKKAPKSAIPAKFVTAKVRRVGGKVQILLNR